MSELLSFEQALARILAAAGPRDVETRCVMAALGQVLAEDVVADRDFPPGPRSAMDGFAVRFADTAEAGAALRVVGEVPAGRSAEGIVVGPGEAVRIFTGAVVPEGADAVVMVELTEEDRAARTVHIRETVRAGQHVRARAEEMKAGETVVRAGSTLGPAEVAALTAVGRTEVRVYRSPSVGVLATGDEVVEAGEAPAPHQVRNSNARGLLAALGRLGLPAEDLGIARDEPAALAAALSSGLRHDVLLVTGGVSVGEYDLVRRALESIGVELLFHGVAVRPGKPVLAGRREGRLVVGLPGNPVSTFTMFEVLVTPALRRMAGHPRPERAWVPAVLREPLRRKPGRRTFALATVGRSESGFEAIPAASRGSGDVLSLVRANALLDAPEGAHALPAGTVLPALVWGEAEDWRA
jgi:molybdopterin molybdotransferase